MIRVHCQLRYQFLKWYMRYKKGEVLEHCPFNLYYGRQQKYEMFLPMKDYIDIVETYFEGDIK